VSRSICAAHPLDGRMRSTLPPTAGCDRTPTAVRRRYPGCGPAEVTQQSVDSRQFYNVRTRDRSSCQISYLHAALAGISARCCARLSEATPAPTSSAIQPQSVAGLHSRHSRTGSCCAQMFRPVDRAACVRADGLAPGFDLYRVDDTPFRPCPGVPEVCCARRPPPTCDCRGNPLRGRAGEWSTRSYAVGGAQSDRPRWHTAPRRSRGPGGRARWSRTYHVSEAERQGSARSFLGFRVVPRSVEVVGVSRRDPRPPISARPSTSRQSNTASMSGLLLTVVRRSPLSHFSAVRARPLAARRVATYRRTSRRTASASPC